MSSNKGYSQKAISVSKPTGKTFYPPVPKPVAPASLEIENITFRDSNGNNIINASEQCELLFTVINKGTGSAYAIQPNIKIQSNTPALSISDMDKISELKPGEQKVIKASLYSRQTLENGKVALTVFATEANGFNAAGKEVKINTKAFDPPCIFVADSKFTTKRGGIPAPAEMITLQILVQNKGLSKAENVLLVFELPANVFPATNSNKYELKTMNPGASKLVEFSFFTNKLFNAPRLEINARLTEAAGKYAESKLLTVSMDQPINQTIQIEIAGTTSPKDVEIGSLHSDVDLNIPVNEVIQKQIFALLIGNERYSGEIQQSKEIDVPFAQNDAIIFKEYINKTLGVPNENITLLTDASKGRIQTEIERLCNMADSYPKQAEIIFYYSGHGMHDGDKNSYLIPVDIPGTQVKQGISLNRLYQRFDKVKASRITVFIDACFSGAARNGSLVAARGIRVVPKDDMVKGNIVIFSAASGNQAALPYKEKQHGIFTYYLLKKLQDTKGSVNYLDLSDYIKTEVQHNSYKVNNAEQIPVTLIGNNITDTWHNFKLK